MIVYPSRIKGEEYPLKRGDIVVCITEHFQEFTYGKQYTLYCDFELPSDYSTLPIESEICPTCGQNFKDTLDMRIICINCERDQKINKVLENE